MSLDYLAVHLRTVHATEIGVTESNNNSNQGSLRTNTSLAAQNEDSLAVASILNNINTQVSNNDIMVSFEDSANNGGEKVRVELVHQQTPSMGSLVLQEQTSNTFRPLSPTAIEIEENFPLNNFLDPDNEIVVT